jgi:hypothetical protein
MNLALDPGALIAIVATPGEQVFTSDAGDLNTLFDARGIRTTIVKV